MEQADPDDGFLSQLTNRPASEGIDYVDEMEMTDDLLFCVSCYLTVLVAERMDARVRSGCVDVSQ